MAGPFHRSASPSTPGPSNRMVSPPQVLLRGRGLVSSRAEWGALFTSSGQGAQVERAWSLGQAVFPHFFPFHTQRSGWGAACASPGPRPHVGPGRRRYLCGLSVGHGSGPVAEGAGKDHEPHLVQTLRSRLGRLSPREQGPPSPPSTPPFCHGVQAPSSRPRCRSLCPSLPSWRSLLTLHNGVLSGDVPETPMGPSQERSALQSAGQRNPTARPSRL